MVPIIGRINVAYEFTPSGNRSYWRRHQRIARDVYGLCCRWSETRWLCPYRFTDLQKNLIEQTWAKNVPHLYGRFDFGYDGENLKMFEYNADTPTSLLEAAVVQWQWLEQIEGLAHRDNLIGFTKNYWIAFSLFNNKLG